MRLPRYFLEQSEEGTEIARAKEAQWSIVIQIKPQVSSISDAKMHSRQGSPTL